MRLQVKYAKKLLKLLKRLISLSCIWSNRSNSNKSIFLFLRTLICRLNDDLNSFWFLSLALQSLLCISNSRRGCIPFGWFFSSIFYFVHSFRWSFQFKRNFFFIYFKLSSLRAFVMLWKVGFWFIVQHKNHRWNFSLIFVNLKSWQFCSQSLLSF